MGNYSIIRKHDLLYHCRIQLNNGTIFETKWANRVDAVSWVVDSFSAQYSLILQEDLVAKNIKYEDGYSYNVGFWWGDILQFNVILFLLLIPFCILMCCLYSQ